MLKSPWLCLTQKAGAGSGAAVGDGGVSRLAIEEPIGYVEHVYKKHIASGQQLGNAIITYIYTPNYIFIDISMAAYIEYAFFQPFGCRREKT